MKMIPYGRQSIDEEDIAEVVKVLKTDWITQGPKIKEFEEALSKYTGAKYAVALSSGTAALHLACLAIDIGEGDEVITSAMTFSASANCVLYCGGQPVFADIESDTANVDPKQILDRVSSKTKAIIPVHFAGHSCNLEKIYEIAQKNNLTIIEDAAHALGAEYKSSKIGAGEYSAMTILSFHPVKHITTGEGGAILTNDKSLYEKLSMLRQHGITKDPEKLLKNDGDWYYEQQLLGYNYRITDFQSALGLSQLKKLDDFIARRREIVKIYEERFKNNDYFEIPPEKDYTKSSYHLYTIRIKDKYKEKKAEIFKKLRASGLGVQVHYIPVYWSPYYEKLGYKRGLCPQTEDFYEREISLPIYPAMSQEDVESVVKIVFETFGTVL